MDTTATPSREPFKFHGNAGDYFRIWIVNVVLTILTVGIYGAWAKVRNKQFFYGNTELAGSRFQYLAQPKQILIGRIIMLIVLAFYLLANYISPEIALIAMVIILLVTPWVLVRSLRFNARMSAWRGIRFNFMGNTAQAYGTFLLAVLVSVVTLGLGTPYALYLIHKYILGKHRFGKTDFQYKAEGGAYFVPYLIAFGLMFVLTIAVSMIMALVLPALIGNTADLSPEANMALGGISIAQILPVLVIYIIFGAIGTYLKVAIANIAYNATHVGKKATLNSNMRWTEVFGIYVTNILAIIFSLGLAIPWAIVRTTKYRVEHLAVDVTDSLDNFIVDEQAHVTAVGDELADGLDIDFGI